MLELKNVSKRYVAGDRRIEVVRDISLAPKEGEFVALVGPSGCGKTTLLKIIAGLEESTSGSILVDGAEIRGPGTERGMVFQDFTLFPWLSIADNIAFGLAVQGIQLPRREEIVRHYLKVTGLEEFRDSYPRDLSGGMQQKAAIARTLANDPKIVLMDEPFAALDAHTRSKMQEFLTALWEKEKKTVVFITHDVGEAAFLADEIHVLTARPAQIKRTFKVPFARPRKHELKKTKEFFEFVTRVTQELED